ncbi:MAG: hypothetical protein O3C49_10780 [Proteobacteria bacterium]|nr:hypothetical protein [Pseudomonadota bacterium]
MTEEKSVIRIGKLDTLGGVLREMGNVYRLARRGKLDTLDGTRLVAVLAEMRRVMEATDLEQRLRALEDSTVTPFRRSA